MRIKRSRAKPSLKRLRTPFFLVVGLSLLVMVAVSTQTVKATPSPNGALNVSDWNNYMSLALGFSDSGFVGGVVLTVILVVLCICPMLFISKARSEIPLIVMLFIGIVAGVALEWISYWILLVPVLLVALLYSGKIRDWASGGN